MKSYIYCNIIYTYIKVFLYIIDNMNTTLISKIKRNNNQLSLFDKNLYSSKLNNKINVYVNLNKNDNTTHNNLNNIDYKYIIKTVAIFTVNIQDEIINQKSCFILLDIDANNIYIKDYKILYIKKNYLFNYKTFDNSIKNNNNDNDDNIINMSSEIITIYKNKSVKNYIKIKTNCLFDNVDNIQIKLETIFKESLYNTIASDDLNFNKKNIINKKIKIDFKTLTNLLDNSLESNDIEIEFKNTDKNIHNNIYVQDVKLLNKDYLIKRDYIYNLKSLNIKNSEVLIFKINKTYCSEENHKNKDFIFELNIYQKITDENNNHLVSYNDLNIDNNATKIKLSDYNKYTSKLQNIKINNINYNYTNDIINNTNYNKVNKTNNEFFINLDYYKFKKLENFNYNNININNSNNLNRIEFIIALIYLIIFLISLIYCIYYINYYVRNYNKELNITNIQITLK